MTSIAAAPAPTPIPASAPVLRPLPALGDAAPVLLPPFPELLVLLVLLNPGPVVAEAVTSVVEVTVVVEWALRYSVVVDVAYSTSVRYDVEDLYATDVEVTVLILVTVDQDVMVTVFARWTIMLRRASFWASGSSLLWVRNVTVGICWIKYEAGTTVSTIVIAVAAVGSSRLFAAVTVLVTSTVVVAMSVDDMVVVDTTVEVVASVEIVTPVDVRYIQFVEVWTVVVTDDTVTLIRYWSARAKEDRRFTHD
jgi:hypothetical protein